MQPRPAVPVFCLVCALMFAAGFTRALAETGVVGVVPLPATRFSEYLVFVEGATEGKGWRPPPRVDLKPDRVTPKVLPVRAGTEVEFRNRDKVARTVLSQDGVQKFHLGRIPPGESRTVTISHPGEHPIRENERGPARLHVVVFAHDAFCALDEKNGFKITGLAPGPAKLVLWHPIAGEKSRGVEVTLDRLLRVELKP